MKAQRSTLSLQRKNNSIKVRYKMASIPRNSKLMKLLAGYVVIMLVLLLTINSMSKFIIQNSGTETNLPQIKSYKNPEIFIDIFPKISMLGNIPDFKFVINHDICKKDPVDLLILIGSNPGNSQIRKLIRDSLGTPRMDKYMIKLVFLYGRPDNSSLQQIILDESAEYEDVVQGTFRDDYYNVTIRDLMGFRWTWRQCSQARYVMHLDDDTSIDIDQVLDALEEKMPANRDYISCFYVFTGSEVFREGRYGLTKQEHPGDTYDNYCSGWVYWFTPGAAEQLDKAALKHTPYKMNDAYLTGTLVTALGWKHLVLKLPFTYKTEDLNNWLKDTYDSAPYFAIGPNECNVTFASLLSKKYQEYAVRNGIPRKKMTT